MIAAFLLPFPVRGERAPYLWFFYKLLSAIKEEMAFLGHSDYLRNPREWIEEDRWEVGEGGASYLEYVVPVVDDFRKHQFYHISDQIYQKLLADSKGNPSSIFRQLLVERMPILEAELYSALSSFKGDVEVILTLCNCPSLTAAASELSIPVVHLELGPLRPPYYKGTCYFDFSGVNGGTEAEARYYRSQWAAPKEWTLSTLRTFFEVEPRRASKSDERYPLGVVLQVEDDSNLIAFGRGFDNQSLLNYAFGLEDKGNILVRAHPGSYFSIRKDRLRNDTSSSSMEFIDKCDKVLTINSSVGLEAILRGVAVTIVGDCSYAFIAEANTPEEVFRRLAHYLLAYLVPIELIFDPEYIRFRINVFDEEKIVLKHFIKYSNNALKGLSEQNTDLWNLAEIGRINMQSLCKLTSILSQDDTENDGFSIFFVSPQDGLQALKDELQVHKQYVPWSEVLGEKRSNSILAICELLSHQEAELGHLVDKLLSFSERIFYFDQIVRARDAQILRLESDIAERIKKMANLDEMLRERDAHVLRLESDIAGHAQKVIVLVEQLNLESLRVADLNDRLTSQDVFSSALARDLHEKSVRLSNAQQDIIGYQVQFKELGGIVKSQQQALIEIEQHLTSARREIASLQRAKAEIEDARNALSERGEGLEKKLDEYSNAESDKEFLLDELVRESMARQARIVKLEKELANSNVQLATIIGSRSWRVTRYLRWWARVLRGDFQAAAQPFRKNRFASADTSVLQIQPSDREPDALKECSESHPVAVVLPVYRGVEMTRRCILSAMPGILSVEGAKIVAINDASPDGEPMQKMLDELASRWAGILFVLRNDENLGFVKTVNRGMEFFCTSDIVFLNSDVVVPRDWLRRLRVDAYSEPSVGTVTPFSNNATIASFPYFLEENPAPFGMAVDDVDKVFYEERLPCVEAPTGVGFCMYIRRSCLDVIGQLNEDRFGRGYGEENDLCQRALKAGWKNLISPNMYAYHEGGVSFSQDKQALVEKAMKTLDELHPNYHADIQIFIRHDPLKPARLARLIQFYSTLPRPKILHVSHNLGGGIGQHLDELAEFLCDRAVNFLLTADSEAGALKIRFGVAKHADELIYERKNYPDLIALLRSCGISVVHIHHTMGLLSVVDRIASDLEVGHVITVHDYYYLSANPTLTDERGIFPGLFVEGLHNPLYPLPAGFTEESWRDAHRELMERANCVIFPSIAAKQLFEGRYAFKQSVVASHVEAVRDVKATLVKFQCRSRYVVGVLGAVGREKGADYLEEIAKLSQMMGLNLEFVLIGYAYRSLSAVEATGPYEVATLPKLIVEKEVDIIFYPALWPETYSYTLSYGLASGLPIVAPNIGAFPERLSGRKNTLLYGMNTHPSDFLRLLLNFVEDLEVERDAVAPVVAVDCVIHDFYSKDYFKFFGEVSLPSLNGAVFDKVKYGPTYARPLSGNRTVRERVLVVLWRCYMHPFLRPFGNFLPYSWKRAVKRRLSRKPMHAIFDQ